MAIDLASKKSDYISFTVDWAERLLDLTRDGEELAAYRTDNGFQVGGTATVVDADCVGANGHMDAATVNAVIALAAALGPIVTTAMRTTLRKASRQPNS